MIPAEDEYETLIPKLFWLGLLAAALVALATGCASTPSAPEVRVCFMKMLGATEQGHSGVAQHCMTPEAFAETQK